MTETTNARARRTAPGAFIRIDRLRWLVLAGLCASGMPAHSDQGLIPYAVAIPREAEGDALTFGVFQLERYDSNFFRLPDGVEPNGSGRRSAITSTTGVGLNIDKRYGLQRFVVAASATYDHYSPFNGLDTTSPRIESAYYWSVTPSLSGRLVFNYARVPTDYEFTGFRTDPNPQTTRTTRLDVDLRPGSGFHPRFSIYESQNSTQDLTFQIESSRSTTAEGALIYEFRSGNVAQVYASRSSGANLNVDNDPVLLISKDFKQSEYGLRAQWQPGGLSNASGRIGYYKRTSNAFPVRDFSGVIGDVALQLELTGKNRLELLASRALYGAETAFSTYYTEDTATARLNWSVTGKITFRPSYNVRRQVYKASPFPTPTALKETTHYITAQVDWAILRSTDLAFAVTRSKRNSNVPSLQFANNSASVFARFKF